MITISLCMIVKNEEDVLDRCLTSVEAAVDEIIIVDTGSTDNTIDIAQRHHAKLYSFKWIDDFAAARNYSFEAASMDYILWLDADDIITPSELRKLLQLKQDFNDMVDIIVMMYHTAFDAAGRPTFSFPRERLIRRGANLRWEGAVHETIPYVANRYISDIAIEHHKLHSSDPKRNLRILEKLKAEGNLNVRQQYYYARELADHQRYEEALIQYENFLNDPTGWIENKIDACQGLALCHRQLGHKQEILQSLFHSFLYAAPRGEVCCAIGSYFYEQQEWTQAVFWFQLATQLPIPEMTGGFINRDCYGYIPWISLCCCYDKQQDWQHAWLANEQAGMIKPDDTAYLYNRKYLSQRFVDHQ